MEEAYSSTQLQTGTATENFDYRLVAKVSKTGDSSTYNEVRFWMNPFGLEADNTAGVSTGSIAIESIDRIDIRSVNLNDDSFLVDNLIIGTEWNDVVPEPSSHGLLLLSLTFLTMKHRKS